MPEDSARNRTIRPQSLLACAALIGASLLFAATADAGTPTSPLACSAANPPACNADLDGGSLRPVDWFDDLFGIKLPPGSWRSSCRKAYVEGHFLYAECRRKSGSYRDTTFDLRNCGGDLGYDNGKIFCDRGYRGEGDKPSGPKPVDPGKD